MATLYDLVSDINSLDDEQTIYAEANPKWAPSSKAIVLLPPDDGRITQPLGAEGMEYFLEVDIAKEVIAVWIKWKWQKLGRVFSPTVEELCEAVIYYAEHDAYKPIK